MDAVQKDVEMKCATKLRGWAASASGTVCRLRKCWRSPKRNSVATPLGLGVIPQPMLDHTGTDDAVAVARGEALRDADHASLTRRAATDNSRSLVDEVLHRITAIEAGARKRQRGSRAGAFRMAVEGFLGDLLVARGEGRVYVPTGRDNFTSKDATYRHFVAAKDGLKTLDLLGEIPGKQNGPATRFSATPQLKSLAAHHGIQPGEADKHFMLPLPKHPLRLMGASTWAWGNKIKGKAMEIDNTNKVTALERTIIDLNDFLDEFDIGGGTHRGYYRQFECGDHEQFEWNLGGRLYSQDGKHSYQQLAGVERRKMTINGKPVCEVDVRASTLTIFQASVGQPLDFSDNPDLDLYALPGLDRGVVKTFITTTFGKGQCPVKWSAEAAEEYEKKTGQCLRLHHPISQVRDAVRKAYPLLGELRRDEAQPPIWARLQFLESEAVLQTMLALRAAGIPSFSVHDSLIVPRDNAELARDTLREMYSLTAGATASAVIRYPEQ
jgi:hypothetical protein